MTKRTGRIKVADYYRFTWQMLLLTTCAVAIASRVARPAVILTYFLLATLMVSSLAGTWRHHRRAVSLAIGGSLLILVTQRLLQASQTEDFISILIEIICGALPWLLLSYDKPRPYWLAVLNVAVIAVGSMTVGTSALIYLGFLLLITLLMLNLNAANLYLASGDLHDRQRELPGGYFRQFLYVIPIGFASAVVIFLFFPRVQSFTLSLTRGLSNNRTGYTGLVTLTADGEVLVSHSLALMIETKDEDWLKHNANGLLMRGDALDTFDGAQWASSNFNYHAPQVSGHQVEANALDSNVRKITVHQEPSSVSSLFYPGKLLSVIGISSANTHFLMNQNGHLIRDPISTDRLVYDVQFLEPIHQPAPESPISTWRQTLWSTTDQSASRPLSEADLDRLLAIPDKVRHAPYFRQWLAELNLDQTSVTLPAIEQRLLQIFTSGFQSTLANTFSGTDALEAFLSKERRGHCEYFATAAALTLRALGVPTRLVVGYRGGLYNDVIGTLDVRDEDAHAWVEIMVPGHGWRTFDPTPSALTAANSLNDRWQIVINSLNFWLHRYIIDYDQTTQKELLAQLRDFGGRSSDQLLDLHVTARQIWVTAAILVAIGGCLYFLSRRRRTHASLDALPVYYINFNKRLAALGLVRESGESLATFHARVANALTPDPHLQVIDHAVHADIYSASALPTDQRDKLESLVSRWRPSLKKRD